MTRDVIFGTNVSFESVSVFVRIVICAILRPNVFKKGFTPCNRHHCLTDVRVLLKILALAQNVVIFEHSAIVADKKAPNRSLLTRHTQNINRINGLFSLTVKMQHSLSFSSIALECN